MLTLIVILISLVLIVLLRENYQDEIEVRAQNARAQGYMEGRQDYERPS